MHFNFLHNMYIKNSVPCLNFLFHLWPTTMVRMFESRASPVCPLASVSQSMHGKMIHVTYIIFIFSVTFRLYVNTSIISLVNLSRWCHTLFKMLGRLFIDIDNPFCVNVLWFVICHDCNSTVVRFDDALAAKQVCPEMSCVVTND